MVLADNFFSQEEKQNSEIQVQCVKKQTLVAHVERKVKGKENTVTSFNNSFSHILSFIHYLLQDCENV